MTFQDKRSPIVGERQYSDLSFSSVCVTQTTLNTRPIGIRKMVGAGSNMNGQGQYFGRAGAVIWLGRGRNAQKSF